jgi:uroporphyrinogen decarboxylase
MTSRERLITALDHEEPDRVPIDMGTPVTSIHREAYSRLLSHLGFAEGETEIIDSVQQAVGIQEPVLERFGVDTRQIFLKPAKVWESAGDGDYVDEWGIRYRASAGGRYYDMVEHPLARFSMEDLVDYDWPDPDDPKRYEGLEERARELFESTEYGIVFNGFSEALFGLPSWLRGNARFYMNFIDDTAFLEALLDRVLGYALRLAENALTQVGRYVHVVRVADDLGTERGTIISPDHYRRFIKPRQEILYRRIKELTDAKLLLHSCGSVVDLIPDFIEIGVDGLNPVQVTARGMETAGLKRRFGKRLTFWGGGCDTQGVLPFGSVADVVEEVKNRLADLAPGGGFVFAPVHNIQYVVSAAKIEAMYDTVLRFGGYPLSLARDVT